MKQESKWLEPGFCNLFFIRWWWMTADGCTKKNCSSIQTGIFYWNYFDYWHKHGKKKRLYFLLFHRFILWIRTKWLPVLFSLFVRKCVFHLKSIRSAAVSQTGPTITQINRSRGFTAEGNKATGGRAGVPVDRGPASAGVMKSRRTTRVEPRAPGKQWDAFMRRDNWGRAGAAADVDCGKLIHMWGKWCGSVLWVCRSCSDTADWNENQIKVSGAGFKGSVVPVLENKHFLHHLCWCIVRWWYIIIIIIIQCPSYRDFWNYPHGLIPPLTATWPQPLEGSCDSMKTHPAGTSVCGRQHHKNGAYLTLKVHLWVGYVQDRKLRYNSTVYRTVETPW